MFGYNVGASHRGHGFSLGNPSFAGTGHNATTAAAASANANSDHSMGVPMARHGSGAGPRDRERDRQRSPTPRARSAHEPRFARGDPTAGRRDVPVGPQEEADWASALENVLNRILTIEGTLRKHAASIAHHDSFQKIIEDNTQRTYHLWNNADADRVREATTNRAVCELESNIVVVTGRLNSLGNEVDGKIKAIEDFLRSFDARFAGGPTPQPMNGGTLPTPTHPASPTLSTPPTRPREADAESL